MKYLILGAGAVGCCLGAYLTQAGNNVTLLARGKRYEALLDDGLTLDKPSGTVHLHPNVQTTEDYSETPDVIFVCVKGYSLDSVLPFLQKTAGRDTVVIPLLNLYDTGERLRKELPGSLVTDGCVYIAAGMEGLNRVKMHGDIFRVVFGISGDSEPPQKLLAVKKDLDKSGITGVLSDNIRRDALLKFSYVSPQATCGLYYHVTAGAMQQEGEIRDCFASLVHEVGLLANAMDIDFGEDIVARNLKILDALLPSSSTSLQRDIELGRPSEIDGLLYDVPEKARAYGLRLPTYEKIAEHLVKNL